MGLRKLVLCGLALAATLTPIAVESRAAQAEQVRVVSGTVMAVVSASRTIVVEAKVGRADLIVGAEVPEGASIKGAKDLADIHAGDRVTLRYVRTGSGLTARSISRLPSK